jgi:hypothetical protein
MATDDKQSSPDKPTAQPNPSAPASGGQGESNAEVKTPVQPKVESTPTKPKVNVSKKPTNADLCSRNFAAIRSHLG